MQPVSRIVNCLSIDVEGFVESNAQSFRIDVRFTDRARETYEIQKNMSVVLEVLNKFRIKATFFFLGRIARDIPDLVREVADAGHEIASHGYEHLRVFGMSKDEFRARLAYSKACLEDISGTKVYGFRAPDFSIVQSSLWALDTIREVGFRYDSSIYPFGYHDVYGISGADPFIHRFSNGLVEFPLSTVAFLGSRVPFGGGGYFRWYPLMLTKFLISRRNQEGHPCMLYVHPYEVGGFIPRISGLPWHRVLRHYHNCLNGCGRFERLARGFDFGTAVGILRTKGLIDD